MGRRKGAAVIGAALALAFGPLAAAHADSPTKDTGHTVHVVEPLRPENARPGAGPTKVNLLTYHGGTVARVPAVYVVYWGWTSDPSGEQPYLESFLSGLYQGETWHNSTTQYCQGAPSGATSCGAESSTVKHVGVPSGTLLKGAWSDPDAAPSSPTQSQLAAEAVKAAGHFGPGVDWTNAQVIVATATGKSSNGFGTSYCAWHSSTTLGSGRLAYTNLPYMSDAGGSCGQSFVNAGTAGLLDGVSIVEGHEYAETITDMYPNGGWLDRGGAENGDKCAWISSGTGASHDIVLGGVGYAVQSLWSNSLKACTG